VGVYPCHDFNFQACRPSACAAQRFKLNAHINIATHQMAMRWAVIAFSDFQSVFVEKTRFSRH
jgi:hypothetical protein